MLGGRLLGHLIEEDTFQPLGLQERSHLGMKPALIIAWPLTISAFLPPSLLASAPTLLQVPVPTRSSGGIRKVKLICFILSVLSAPHGNGNPHIQSSQ